MPFDRRGNVRTSVYVRKKRKKTLGAVKTSGKVVESINGDHPTLKSGKHSKERQPVNNAGNHERA